METIALTICGCFFFLYGSVYHDVAEGACNSTWFTVIRLLAWPIAVFWLVKVVLSGLQYIGFRSLVYSILGDALLQLCLPNFGIKNNKECVNGLRNLSRLTFLGII